MGWWEDLGDKLAGNYSKKKEQARVDATLAPAQVAAPAPVTAAQGSTTGVSGGNVDQDAIFNLNKAFADQSVTTGPALQAALASRLKDMGDQTAEQFNINGQSPQSGVFADAMARSIGRTGLEAELSQQQARSQAIQNMFGQGRAGAFDMAGKNTEYSNKANELNSTNALNAAMFNAGSTNTMAVNKQNARQAASGNAWTPWLGLLGAAGKTVGAASGATSTAGASY